MRFLKYFFYLCLIVFFTIFYLFYTPSGKRFFYAELSEWLTKEAGFNVKLLSLNVEKYPKITSKMKLEERVQLVLDGNISLENINIDYDLKSHCIATDICELKDEVNIVGKIDGTIKKAKIDGEGKALEGKVKYVAIKKKNSLEDFNASLEDINVTKLFKLFGQKSILKGDGDIELFFTKLSKEDKNGTIKFNIDKNYIQNLPILLSGTLFINNQNHRFNATILSIATKLNLFDGTIKEEKKELHSFYTLYIKDLTKLEKALGSKLYGDFYAMGEVNYKNNEFKINGLSKTYKGILDYTIKKEEVNILLKSVSFLEFMKIFDLDPILDANVFGTIDYNLTTETIKIDTKLKKTKFLHKEIATTLYKKAGVNILKETFDNSSIKAIYQDNIIRADIKLANKKSHLYLQHIRVDLDKNTIDAYFDFDMQKQKFSGKIYGSLDDPEVNLDLQKLIEYQMIKQLDAMMGTKTRKEMGEVVDSIPMTDVAKEAATGAATGAATFMKVFF